MSMYEATFILRQDIPSTEVSKAVDNLTSVIKENDGEVLKHEYWGLRTLAYPVKKNKKGHYIMLILNAPHKGVLELQRRVKLSEDIIRNLTVKIDAFDKKDSIMMSPDNKEN